MLQMRVPFNFQTFKHRSLRAARGRVRAVACCLIAVAYAGSAFSQATAPDTYEPDNSPSQASHLILSGVAQTHNLYPVGDYDLFTFTLNADTTLYFDFEVLDPDPKPIIALGVFPSALMPSTTIDGLIRQASYIQLTADTAQFGPVVRTASFTKGTYYIVVLFYSCPATGNCNFTPNYRLAVTDLSAPDRYQPDDTAATARWINLNGPAQIHQFNSATDQAWMAFYSPGPGRTLTITAIQAGALAQPFVQLYAADATTLLALSSKSADAAKAELVSQIVYVTQPTDTGILYVRVSNTGKTGGSNPDESYAVSVKSDSVLPGALAGVVTNAASSGGGCGGSAPQAIANASITIPSLGNLSSLSDATGAYSFVSIPSNTYSVTAAANGYVSQTKSASVGGSVATLDFSLSPSGKRTAAYAAFGGGGDALLMGLALLAVRLFRRRRNAE